MPELRRIHPDMAPHGGYLLAVLKQKLTDLLATDVVLNCRVNQTVNNYQPVNKGLDRDQREVAMFKSQNRVNESLVVQQSL